MKLVIGRYLNINLSLKEKKEYNVNRKKVYTDDIYVWKNEFLRERLLKTYNYEFNKQTFCYPVQR